MEKMNLLIRKLEKNKTSGINDLITLTESPIEKIFLLCILNFVEESIKNEFISRIGINGYSYINNAKPENDYHDNSVVGLKLISVGTGVSVNYPNGIPMADGSFSKTSNNPLRRKATIQRSESSNHFSYIQELLFFPQYQVQVNKRDFRIDFAFLLYESINHESKLMKKLAVECDGYNYHSSHTHFKRDRERARLLQKDDWTIIRYSGSDINVEFFNNYEKEIVEIFDQMGFGVFN
jgi:very-short-patch-repair endonuclease